MYRLAPAIQHYAWGSSQHIPQLLGIEVTDRPVSEAWFGAHPSAPAVLSGASEPTLDALVAADPHGVLGDDVVARFGEQLPYLLKLIAAASPVSLQVHPSRARARDGFERESAAGVPIDAPHRSYRDRNHKPELVFALTRLEAMVGFRAPRRAAELLTGLESALAEQLHKLLIGDPSPQGVRDAFQWLLAPGTRPHADDVAELARACQQRLDAGSPSPRTDRTVIRLHAQYPGDPGAVTSVLLNPVTLQPGEVLFVPAGAVHSYLEGFAVELMANSDNVLRAGLTPKHVDVAELLETVDTVAAPPIRIAPEHVFTSTDVFYAPVDDFELSVTHLTTDDEARVPGRGPRIVLCLEGDVEVRGEHDGALRLSAGQAAFVPASDGPLVATGRGRMVQADVP
ncbi:mannose-6-phosphate isomerase, class I [Cellulomonas composti]|uniref:mannose-6-phosphate isomerase n=1 Tax=Cellulomonas composti TaxID=266130 RepID=A0A511JB48_9CELL|nr:mannose-6-phosphate isomerase, class I [Cellulomonas composti]GEL95198.1 mannose-6-phosphate isomerase [Cellulomonas composti]